MTQGLHNIISKSKVTKNTKIALSNILVDDKNAEPDVLTDTSFTDLLPYRIKGNLHKKWILYYLRVAQQDIHNKYISKQINQIIMGLLLSNSSYRVCLIDELKERDIATVGNMMVDFDARVSNYTGKANVLSYLMYIIETSDSDRNFKTNQLGTFWCKINYIFNYYLINLFIIDACGGLTKFGKQVIKIPDSRIKKYSKAISYNSCLSYSVVLKRLINRIKQYEMICDKSDNHLDNLCGLFFADQLFSTDTNLKVLNYKSNNGHVYQCFTLIKIILIVLNLFTSLVKNEPIKANPDSLETVNKVIKSVPYAIKARQQVRKYDNPLGL